MFLHCFPVSSPWNIFKILGSAALQFSIKMSFFHHYFLKHFSLPPPSLQFQIYQTSQSYSTIYWCFVQYINSLFYVSFLNNHFTSNLYTIKFILLNCTVVFSTLTKLCNNHHYLIPEYFHHPKKKLHVRQQSFPIPPSPLTSALDSHPITFSLDRFAYLDISYKWNVLVPQG